MKKIAAIFCILILSCASKKENFGFEKIIFHTSPCYGFCPVYHLQINKDKTFLLYNEIVYKNPGKLSSEKDSLKSGYFKGKVDSKLYETLLSEMKKIDKVNFNNLNCCDGSTKTIITYYNGKRRFIQTMFPPEHSEKFISILYEICEKSDLTKSNEKFEIENTSR